jgi:hypothetical protein
MQIDLSSRQILTYLRQERAREGFAVGEVSVAQPDTFIASKAPSRQPIIWKAPKQAMASWRPKMKCDQLMIM